MITVLVRVIKASRMIVILMASHDDRFHSTPVGDTSTQTKALRSRHRLCQLSCSVRGDPTETQPVGLLIAQRVCVWMICVHKHTQKILLFPNETTARASRHQTFTSNFIWAEYPPGEDYLKHKIRKKTGRGSIWHRLSHLK